MTIRKKILFPIAGLFFAVLIIMAIGSRYAILSGYFKLEDDEANKNLSRIQNAFFNEINSLERTNQDYAAWDDTYIFTEDLNTNFVTANFTDESLSNLNVNSVLIFDENAKLLYVKNFELNDDKYFLAKKIRTKIISEKKKNKIKSGIISFQNEPVIFSELEIVRSDKSGRSRGKIVMLRKIENSELKSISDEVQLPIKISQLANSSFSLIPQFHNFKIEKVNSEIIKGKVFLKDFEEQNIFVLQTEIKREIYSRGKKSLFLFFAALFVITIIFAAAIMFLIDKLVLARITNLNDEVVKIGSEKDLKNRVHVTGNDEISNFSKEFNVMMNALESAQNELEKRNANLKELSGKLQQSEISLKKLNANKDKFFSIIGHDLKGPFTSLLGYSEALTNDIEKLTDEQIKQFSETIYRTSKNIFRLLENLLTWSRLQRDVIKFKKEKFPINELIHQTLETFELNAREKQIKLIAECEVEIFVNADKNMIETVLRNLISNAVKFTRNDGIVKISIEKNEENILVKVADNGIGIEEKDLNKLFKIESNFSSEGTNYEKGTGLGLVLCKDFVDKHSGKIWAESFPGKGSEFKFTIPV